MGDQPTQQDSSFQTPEVNPWPVFGTPSSTFDRSAVKPHKCMDNIINRGNFIHCVPGNHGIRIPLGKMLSKDSAGNWIFVDMPLTDSKTGEIVANNFMDVIS